MSPRYQRGDLVARQDNTYIPKPAIPKRINRTPKPQPVISQDNRSNWQHEQASKRADMEYNRYMEAKKTEEGLHNLNGFLNFADYAGMATGVGGLANKGLKWGAKKLVKRGIHALPKEKYVNLGTNFNSDHDIDRELANVIDYFNQRKTTERLSQIDSKLGTNYIKGRNWLLNEYSNGNIKLNKMDRFTGTTNQSSTQPLMEFLSNPTYKNMKTDIVRQDPTPVVGHEVKHGLENYIEVLNNPNMNAEYFRAQHGTGKRLQAMFDKENIREFKDFYHSIKREFPRMSDEQVVGTYKYLTNTSEFSSNLQPFISANMMRGRDGVPNYKDLADLEDVMNNTFKMPISVAHDPMAHSKTIYNHLVKDKQRFLDTFNKYGFAIAAPIIGSKYGNAPHNQI